MDEQSGLNIAVLHAKAALLEQLLGVLIKDKFRSLNFTAQNVRDYSEEIKSHFRQSTWSVGASLNETAAKAAAEMMGVEVDRFFDLVISGIPTS